MGKKIAVVARKKQSEAFRMAAGLTILDDEIFLIVDGAVDTTAESREQLELVGDIGIKACSTVPFEGLGHVSMEEMADALLSCDVVLAY